MQLMLSNAWYPPGNCNVPWLPVQPGRHPWIILVGKTTGWGEHTVEGAWPWVLNCEMRQQPTSGPSQLGGLSTHWRSQQEGEGVRPALKDGTDEATAGVRLSPSAEGGKTVLTGPSGS